MLVGWLTYIFLENLIITTKGSFELSSLENVYPKFKNSNEISDGVISLHTSSVVVDPPVHSHPSIT